MSNTVAQSAEEDLTVLKDALQSNQTKRWQAVGMLKHIFSSANLPWELKKHTINFLLWIMDGNLSEKCNDEVADCSSYVPGLFASLQVVACYILVYTYIYIIFYLFALQNLKETIFRLLRWSLCTHQMQC